MDADGFDRLAKTVSGGADRRQLLAGLGAVLAGLWGQPVAAAPAKPNGKPCTTNGQCRSEHCCRVAGQNSGTCRDCCDDGDCGPGRVCRNQTCVPDPGTCSAGQNKCRGGPSACGDQRACNCFATTSGATFCGLASRCSNCSRDEDCAEVTGIGSVCVDVAGDICPPCHSTNSRACVAPCGPCTSDAQCRSGQVCCDGECQSGNCCTAADCRNGDTCERGRCECVGCRDRDTCRSGSAWTECGAEGVTCAPCAEGQVCAAESLTCTDCERKNSPGGTFCQIRDAFRKYQCSPKCRCAKTVQGSGVCFDGPGYCTGGAVPLCLSDADCVREELGTHCVRTGDCAGIPDDCDRVCVTACGERPPRRNTNPGDGELQIVRLD